MLLDILKSESRTINDEFALASSQGKGTPQEISDFRENAVQAFIKRYYPQSHIVSKGKITDLDGKQSNSIDCLILNPEHPNLTDSKGKFRLIFADGCDAAIEVKPALDRKEEIHRGLKQGISVKNVTRSKSAILLRETKSEEVIAFSQRVPFYLFAVSAFPVERLYEVINDFYKENATDYMQQIDGIVILGVGILKNITIKELNAYGAEYPIGKNTGWYFEKWGEATLMGMLLNLQYSFTSFPRVGEPIMKRILTKISRFEVERIGDVT